MYSQMDSQKQLLQRTQCNVADGRIFTAHIANRPELFRIVQSIQRINQQFNYERFRQNNLNKEEGAERPDAPRPFANVSPSDLMTTAGLRQRV